MKLVLMGLSEMQQQSKKCQNHGKIIKIASL